MLIQRTIAESIKKLACQYPVVTITGPRQAGKSTLCKMIFPEKAYVTLEDIDNREYATGDPRGFLSKYPEGLVLDEIQRAPQLLSYIQTIVDNRDEKGLYILTGSQQFEMMAGISQSLAGRTAVIRLLPFSYKEIYKDTISDLYEVLYKGFYPRIFNDELNPSQFYSFYISTYLERDVRSIINVKNLAVFEVFLKICAGRSGQLLNLSNISVEVGVDQKTIKEWLSVLETSYIIKIVRPYYKNLNKRLVKMPKLYFLDTGLLCFLLGIRNTEQISTHPLYGAIFETYIISQLFKNIYNNVETDNLYFYRDQKGVEIDIIFDYASTIECMEIKAGKTIMQDFFKHINKLATFGYTVDKKYIAYGGDESRTQNDTFVKSWREI